MARHARPRRGDVDDFQDGRTTIFLISLEPAASRRIEEKMTAPKETKRALAESLFDHDGTPLWP